MGPNIDAKTIVSPLPSPHTERNLECRGLRPKRGTLKMAELISQHRVPRCASTLDLKSIEPSLLRPRQVLPHRGWDDWINCRHPDLKVEVGGDQEDHRLREAPPKSSTRRGSKLLRRSIPVQLVRLSVGPIIGFHILAGLARQVPFLVIPLDLLTRLKCDVRQVAKNGRLRH